MRFVITQEESGQRLDKWLSTKDDDWSRSLVQQWIKSGCVMLGGAPCTDTSYKIKEDDQFDIDPPEAKPLLDLTPYPLALDIRFEDEHVIVLNKPVGLPVHPGPGHREKTLVHALLAHCGDTLSSMGGQERPGIVHRLDMDTSGLMIVAKHDNAHRFLSKQLETRTMSRTYQALVYGVPFPACGTITANIGRSKRDRKKMTVVQAGGREAVTHYKILSQFGDGAVSLVECKLETGRTHQIRVHMSFKGYPIIGDKDYDRKRFHSLGGLEEEACEAIRTFPRQALHAYALAFIHPETKETMQFEVPLAADMVGLLERL